MKILHLDFDDLKSPLGGGQARVIYEISRRLAKRHEITIITSKYPGSKDEKIDNINYVRIGLEKFPWNFFAYIFLAPWFVRKVPHDILIESFVPPISTMNTPLFTKKPVIGMVQWFFAREMSQKYKLPFLWWEKLGIKLYKNFIVYNNDLANKFQELLPKANILVNTFPVDGPKIKPKFSEKDYILFLGRIDIHHKGLDLLVKAFEKIASEISTKLIIAGGGRQEKKFAKIVKKSNSSSKIKFIGRYDARLRDQLLSKCKLVVMPSRYEMAPLVAKEAMSFAKPVIAFKISGTREVLSPSCAVFVDPYDVNLFAQAILALLKDQNKRIRMGKNGRERFEKDIDWEESAQKQEAFCLKVLNSNK
jgi:glycosyltransferase involved in cell wall biosynthesis